MNCPDGWYSAQGVCMKAFENATGLTQAQVSSLHWTIPILFCCHKQKVLIHFNILHCTKTRKMREKYSNGDYSGKKKFG